MPPKENPTKNNIWIPIAILCISISAALGWALVDALRAGLQRQAAQFPPLVSVTADTYWPLAVARLLDANPDVPEGGLRAWLTTKDHLVACIYDVELERTLGPLLAAAKTAGLRPAVVIRTGLFGGPLPDKDDEQKWLALCDTLGVSIAYAHGEDVRRLMLMPKHWQ